MAKYSVTVISYPLDLLEESLEDHIHKLQNTYEIGLLIYNAALSPIGKFVDQELETHVQVINLNCYSLFFAFQYKYKCYLALIIVEMEEGALIQPNLITQEIIDIIIQKIVKTVNPEKIILFGSYAKGNYHSKSDLDIAVIVRSSKEPKYRRAVPIRLALSYLIFPKDIVVFTEQEIQDWQDVPQAFVTTILKTGKLIYEKDKK